MLKHLTATALLGLMMAAPAAAQTSQKPDRPDRPRAAVQQRIRDGVRTGTINRQELSAIRKHLQSFRGHVRDMRKDGSVTRAEHRALKQELRQISRQVFRAKHRK